MSPVAALATTLIFGSVHSAVISACALQLALHFASALGPVTSASQRGAFQVPLQLEWQLALQLP
jgi:hypothetical protein